MATTKLVLVVAMPGIVQEGLQALLSIIPDVEVLVATDCASALETVERDIPSLVIVDEEGPEDSAPTVINRVKASWPDINCIALVGDEQQREQAQEAGDDLVLIKGFPAAKLIATIEELLSEEADL
jgi:DNA-binding NarL/FixJ family response regulator